MNNNKFKTSDLNLAAFLRTKKVELDQVVPDKEQPRRALFIFNTTNIQIEPLQRAFYDNTFVGVIDFIKELDNLKSMARNSIHQS